MSAGRPLKFTSVEDLEKSIEAYFAARMDRKGNIVRPVSITGLALHLDTCRQTLLNYEGLPEFLDSIKKAKLRVEQFYEERLTLPNAGGSIFALKNFGWSDAHDFNHGGQRRNPIRMETVIPASTAEEAYRRMIDGD